VRHGETEMNRADLFRGRSDPPLNETGLEQARATGESLARLEFRAFYASPLARSMRTARAIAERHASEVRPLPAFIDIDYGAWSGLSAEEVRSRWPRCGTYTRDGCWWWGTRWNRGASHRWSSAASRTITISRSRGGYP
jgi:broad specificity phosphatase PhoE